MPLPAAGCEGSVTSCSGSQQDVCESGLRKGGVCPVLSKWHQFCAGRWSLWLVWLQQSWHTAAFLLLLPSSGTTCPRTPSCASP